MPRSAGFVAALLLLAGCPRRVDEPRGAERAVRLIADTPERETTTLTQARADIEVDTRDHDRTPRVVATGETPLLAGAGLAARLYGDEAGTLGWGVDNFLLIEVLAEDGAVLDRCAIGFADNISIGTETIDNLGRRAFNFEPGEINLTPRLPEKGAFKLRATALDYFGVGRVSDVWLRLKAEAGDRGGDDLKGQ